MTDKQTWGDAQGYGQLQVMKSYGTKTGMSDLAIVLGGIMDRGATSDGQCTGDVWSASSVDAGYVRIVNRNGLRALSYPYGRLEAARPALPSSVASLYGLNYSSPQHLAQAGAKLGRIIKGKDGQDLQLIEYGEYPQTIAPKNIGRELEQAILSGKLKKTGKKYTFDAEKFDAYDKPFKAEECAEYEYKGTRYIHVEARPHDKYSVLSNGYKPKAGEACWIEVQPIEWLRDPSGICIARQALFAGVRFDRKKAMMEILRTRICRSFLTPVLFARHCQNLRKNVT